jgi:hypothetical protein
MPSSPFSLWALCRYVIAFLMSPSEVSINASMACKGKEIKRYNTRDLFFLPTVII